MADPNEIQENGYTRAANDGAHVLFNMLDDLVAECGEASQVAQDGDAGDELWIANVACIIDGVADERLSVLLAENAKLRALAERRYHYIQRLNGMVRRARLTSNTGVCLTNQVEELAAQAAKENKDGCD